MKWGLPRDDGGFLVGGDGLAEPRPARLVWYVLASDRGSIDCRFGSVSQGGPGREDNLPDRVADDAVRHLQDRPKLPVVGNRCAQRPG
jgi:hypothetical protein